MTDDQRDRQAGDAQDEIDETLEPGRETSSPEHAAQQDFAARASMMSNAFPGSATPVSGAIIGSGGDLEMDPRTEEEEIADEREGRRLPPHESR